MAKLGQYGHQLETMTAQEVLDVGVEHLLTQMAKSENGDNNICLYDGGSVCCAAAPFIKDEIGFSFIGGWRDLVFQGWADEVHKDLISELQGVHDECGITDWAFALRELATREKLVYNGEQYE